MGGYLLFANASSLALLMHFIHVSSLLLRHNYRCTMAVTAFQHQPKLQGILTALPSSLPFHPYNDNHPSHRRQNPHNKYRHRRRRAEEEVYHHNDPEGATADDYIEDAPIYPSNSEEDSFTLFLFVDGTNRHGVSLPFLSLANGFSMR